MLVDKRRCYASLSATSGATDAMHYPEINKFRNMQNIQIKKNSIARNDRIP